MIPQTTFVDDAMEVILRLRRALKRDLEECRREKREQERVQQQAQGPGGIPQGWLGPMLSGRVINVFGRGGGGGGSGSVQEDEEFTIFQPGDPGT